MGTPVTVTGSGLIASHRLTVTYDGSTAGMPTTCTTDALGNVSSGCAFTVPSSSVTGPHVVAASDGTNNPAAIFTVVAPFITLSPSSGPVGTLVAVAGEHFIASHGLTVTYDGSTAGMPTTCTTDASGDVSYGCTFTVPLSSSGPHTVTVSDGTYSPTATFTVTAIGGPHVYVTPTRGAAGTTVVISGIGLVAYQSVSATFDGTSLSLGGTCATTFSGGLSGCTFTVPSSALGPHTVAVSDGTNSPTATFTVTSPPIACGSIITTDTLLGGSIGPCSGDGLVVGASSITLDCAGQTISGTDANLSAGIRLAGVASVQVKNCRVTGFYYGLYLNYSYSDTFTNNSAFNNLVYGFDVHDSNTNTLTGNTAMGNYYGIALLEGATPPQIWQQGNTYNNVLTDDTVISNKGYGFFDGTCCGGTGTLLTHNEYSLDRCIDNGLEGAVPHLLGWPNDICPPLPIILNPASETVGGIVSISGHRYVNSLQEFKSSHGLSVTYDGSSAGMPTGCGTNSLGEINPDCTFVVPASASGPHTVVVSDGTNTWSTIIWVLSRPSPVACGDIITSSTTLSSDIGPCSGDGFVIGADNITLDCAGHTISGVPMEVPLTAFNDFTHGILSPISLDGTTTGIRIAGGRTGVTVKNCNVKGFYDDFGLYSSFGNTLTNNTANNCDWSCVMVWRSAFNGGTQGPTGFLLWNSSRNTLTDNKATNNVIGFHITTTNLDTEVLPHSDFSNGNMLTSNSDNDSYFGFQVSSGFNNTLVANRAANFLDDGFGFMPGEGIPSSGMTLIGNTAIIQSPCVNPFTLLTCPNAGYGGFEIDGSHTLAVNNTAEGMYGDGFRVGTTNSTLIGNTANNDFFIGFLVEGSSNVALLGNTVNGSLNGITVTSNTPYVWNGTTYGLGSNVTLAGNTVTGGVGSVVINGFSALASTWGVNSTVLGTTLPSGTLPVNLTSTMFYDVREIGITGGAADICEMTNQTSAMQYWNGTQWVEATSLIWIKSGGKTMVCGEIPVSDLGGTPVAVGSGSASGHLETSITIATAALSSYTITVGGSVKDSVKLAGVTSDARGTVRYKVFSGGSCAGAGIAVGSPVTVTNGIVPDSASRVFVKAGAYSWRALYSGDSNNKGAKSPCEPLTVARHTTTLTVLCSPVSVVSGSKTACKATVTGYYPTGSVTWSQSGTGSVSFAATKCKLSRGSCSVTMTGSGAGSVTIKAAYSRDVSNQASSGWDALAITGGSARTTQTTLSCTHASVVVGSKTACKATVKGSGTTPTGTVTWSSSSSGTFSMPVCTLSKGACSVKFTPTSVGSPVTLTANYGGDSKNPKSAGTYNLGVTMKATKITISCKPKSIVANSSTIITCTAKVTGHSPIGTVSWLPTGTGSVYFNSATCTLSQGTCSVTMTGTTAGKVTIQGTFSGDSNNQGSSKTATLTVKKASTTVVVSCTPPSLGTGSSSTTCTATVSGGLSSQNGTITWSKGSGKGSVTFSSTTCTLPGICSVTVTITTTNAGSIKIKAVYSGDANDLKSSRTYVLTIT